MIRFGHAKILMPTACSALLMFVSAVLAQEASSPVTTIRGIVQSISKIEIRTDLSVPIMEAKYRKGMAFQKDDILITFDCARYKSERAAANASANAASIELRQKRTLLKHGATGKSDVDLANAAMSKSLAERDVIEQRMKDCTIKAPFAGRVVATTANAREMPKPSEPLLVIIDDANLEIEMVIPSDYLSKIKQDSIFSIIIDETSQTVQGTVSRFGAEVDPVSQTIEVIGKLQTQPSLIRAGMSGSVTFDAINKGGT